jgi:DNA helicase IV
MSEREAELAAEQAYINYAYDCLESMRERLESLPDAGAHPKDAAALRQLSEEIGDRYADAGQGLCIGRIDAEAGETHYIGRTLVRDETGPILINWRARAAEPFYRATVEDRMGLSLRRRFETNGRVLLDMVDEVFDARLLDLGVAFPQGVDDLLLVELERSRTPEMRDIAATIKREQYELITRPLEELLVVQGAPGTGKTAVGLHRAAWLLFNREDVLRQQGVLVVGPNRAFMQYVSQVLPSLGETSVDQSDIDHLVPGVRARALDEPPVQRIKADPRMAELLARALAARIRPPTEDIEATFNYLTFTIPAGSVAGAVEVAQTSGLPFLDARQRFIERFAELYFSSYATATRSRAQLRMSGDTQRDIQRERDFQNALDRIWPTLSAKQFVHELLSGPNRLAAVAGDLLTAEEQRLLLGPPGPLEQATWTGSDLPLLDEAEALLRGTAETYGHVIVDEAQDLTPMQLRMVARRSATGSMTVVGDIAQGTGIWPYRSWSQVLSYLPGGGSANVRELRLGYRVPKQIMDLALPILAATAPETELPIAYRDGGTEPAFIRVDALGLVDRLVDEVMVFTETAGTAGVIVPESLLPAVRAALATARIEYGEALRDPLGPQLELLTPRAAKGLEFDDVAGLEPARNVAESETNGLRELYVSLTRATQHLTIVFAEDLPELIQPAELTSPVPAGAISAPPRSESPQEFAASHELGEVHSFSARLTEAFALARSLHANQLRKGTATPYLAHLLGVCSLVLEDGGDEDQAVAALLHDAPEDQGGEETLRQIRRQFGPRVAEIVSACTDTAENPKPPWRARKERYLEKLGAETDSAVLRVALADKLHNARATLADYRVFGADLWKRFDTSSDQLWYYRALVDAFARAGARGALLTELESVVLELERLAAAG